MFRLFMFFDLLVKNLNVGQFGAQKQKGLRFYFRDYHKYNNDNHHHYYYYYYYEKNNHNNYLITVAEMQQLRGTILSRGTSIGSFSF